MAGTESRTEAVLGEAPLGRVIKEAELLARGYRKADVLASKINGWIGFSVYEKAKRDTLSRLLAELYQELGFEPQFGLRISAALSEAAGNL